MREGWQIRKLGDVCSVRRDSSIHTGMNYVGLEHISSGNGVLVSLADTSGVIGTTNLFNAGDVLYGKLRPYLKKVIVADCDGCCSTEILPIRCNGDILPDFLKYWFLEDGITDKINATCGGCRMPRANMKDVFQFAFAFPSLPEQQRIVDILDQEFAKIDALKANAEKSLQAAKDLFQATLKKELEPKEGWKTIRMGDYFRITSSKRVFQADWTDKGVPFYRAREIVKLAKYGSVDNDLFITPEMYDTYKAKYGVPKVGDVLITGVGTLGVCFLVENENPFYFKDGNVIWLQKEKEISSRYVIYCYQTNDVKEQVHSTQGAVVGTYTIEKANATTIPLPPTMEIQEEIVSRLDDFNDKCNALQENYQKSLTLCDDLKQSLLRKAFNGEL